MPEQAKEQVKEQFDNSAKKGVPENQKYGVGGTGEDGGVSTADTVADGGVDEDQPEDSEFKP